MKAHTILTGEKKSRSTEAAAWLARE